MKDPTCYREADVTYYVGPFTSEEQIFVDCYKLRAMRYGWRHNPTGRTGHHTVYVFPEDVKRFPRLVAHWNRTKEWTYSPGVEKI